MAPPEGCQKVRAPGDVGPCVRACRCVGRCRAYLISKRLSANRDAAVRAAKLSYAVMMWPSSDQAWSRAPACGCARVPPGY